MSEHDDDFVARLVGRPAAALMVSRKIADEIRLGVRRVGIKAARALAEGFLICDKQRAELYRENEVLRDGLLRACSIATTHRPEDREEILELAKLGAPK